MATKSLKKRVKPSHLTTAKLIKALFDGPSTARELADVSGYSIATVYEFVRALRKVEVAFISAWEPDSLGRMRVAVFSMGERRDKKREAFTRREISARARERKRQRILAEAIAGKPVDPKNFLPA